MRRPTSASLRLQKEQNRADGSAVACRFSIIAGLESLVVPRCFILSRRPSPGDDSLSETC